MDSGQPPAATSTLAPNIPTFIAVALGQTASALGSVLATFAIGVHIFHETNSVTLFALGLACASLPIVLFSPLAGALVDRISLRLAVIAADTVSALTTLVLAVLLLTDSLTLWHLYAAAFISSTARTIQSPAFIALSTLMLPAKHYGRGSGLVQFGEAMAQVIAPLAAGFMISIIGLGGILILDGITFVLGVVPLLILRIPHRQSQVRGRVRDVYREALTGIRYVLKNRGFVVLVSIAGLLNVFLGFAEVLVTPLVLRIANEASLGIIVATSGLGMVLGSVVLMVWGGANRRVPAILTFSILMGASLIFAGSHPSLIVLGIGSFLFLFWIPLINGNLQALWQQKVPVHLQGRVFSVRLMVAYIALPLAQLAAGPLADSVFEPLLENSDLLAQLFGNEPGRGIGLLFVAAGLVCIALFGLLRLYRPLLEVDDLPDANPESLSYESNMQ